MNWRSLLNMKWTLIMLPKAEEYRTQAAECLHQSDCVNDQEIKRTFRQLAARWLKMAEGLEAADRKH
jgi:hypothetical protein